MPLASPARPASWKRGSRHSLFFSTPDPIQRDVALAVETAFMAAAQPSMMLGSDVAAACCGNRLNTLLSRAVVHSAFSHPAYRSPSRTGRFTCSCACTNHQAGRVSKAPLLRLQDVAALADSVAASPAPLHNSRGPPSSPPGAAVRRRHRRLPRRVRRHPSGPNHAAAVRGALK